MREIALILLAAGESRRFKEDSQLHCKKQWLRVGDTPLWCFVTRQFHQLYSFKQTVVALSPEEIHYAKAFVDGFEIVAGGSSRQESLLRALQKVETQWVLVSDVARCYIGKNVLDAILSVSDADCVAPYLEVYDTVYSDDFGYLQRHNLKRIQTPQLCYKPILLQSLAAGSFTDESSAIKSYGGKVAFVQGSPKLHKITRKEDLYFFDLPPPSNDIFVGSSFDVHGFKDGDYLMLCGIRIPYTKAFDAHSDGDVGLHALVDALFGAVGGGDIGEWFPDTDNAFKNIDSGVLLQKTLDVIRGVGFKIVNVDLTIVAQEPKITPHKERMRTRLSSLVDIPISKINIKATTTENLGFLGRCEGIAVICSVSVKYFDWGEK